MPHENVFQTIQRQMVAKLADDDLCNQPGTGDASCNRPLGRRRTRHAVFAVAASVLRSHMLMHFQLRRHVFENRRHVFADAVLRTPAATTRLLCLWQVQFVPMVRQTGKIELAATTASMSGNLLTRLFTRGGKFRLVGRSQIKQMLLPFALDDAFAPAAMNPALVPSEFIQRRGVLFSQFLK